MTAGNLRGTHPGRNLDWNYIERQLRPLAELKGSPETLDKLRRHSTEFEC